MKVRNAVVGLLAAAVLSACGGQAGDSSEKVLKFAVVAEETGQFGPYGIEFIGGIRAAVEDLNASGDYDFKLEPKFYDCQSEQAVCVGKVRQAITTDKMPLVVGPIVSLNAVPAAEVTSRSDIPHLFTTVFPELTSKFDNTYRWTTRADRSNGNVVEYVVSELKPGDDVALMYANTEFGQGSADQQTEFLGEAGLEPVLSVAHDPGQTDYTPAILQLKKANPRFILLSSTSPVDVALILKQARDAGVDSQWIGANTSGAIDLAGDAAKGYMVVSPWFPNNISDPESIDLTKRLTEVGLEKPDGLAGLSYDMIMGIAEAGKAKGLTSAELTEGIEQLTNMQGRAIKSWTFSAEDREGLQDSIIVRWNGSAYETVWTKGPKS